MSARPTGRFHRRDDGLYLLLDRLFSAPIEDVWHDLTNPVAMQAWIGTYTGDPATGGVRFQMSQEGSDEWQYISIHECDPPHRFTVDGRGDGPEMHLFCHLHEAAGMTTLTLGQRLKDPADAESYGPGWDWYLDRLIASREGTPMPEWDAYFPAFSEYYGALVVPAE